MRRTVQFAVFLSLSATITLSACSDPALPTQVADAPTGFVFANEPAPGFDAMRRNTPLSSPISLTRVIGVEGGRMEIAEAGITFVVPPAALTEPTEITLHALKGEAMAFEFAPHGLQFLIPASIHLRVSDTEAEMLLALPQESRELGLKLDGFIGVYFEGDPNVGVEPLENIDAYMVNESIVFSIRHFSGYVCASG